MRVSVRLTIDIDADAWSNEYGVDRADVRQDVREYVANALWDMPVQPNSVEVK